MRGHFASAHFAGQPWALMPERFEAYAALTRRWANGERVSAEVMDSVRADVEAREARKAANANAGGGSVRVLPLYGVITMRANVMNELSGPGSISTQMFLASLRDALADESVGAIVVDIDSPGGSVYQIQETADEIYKARSQKPIYGIANCLAASAAYWLGTQCTHLYCTPSGEVGSIGVLAVHEDWSKANEMAGVKPTYISAGPYKTELNADEPLGDEARAYQQSRIDDYYGAFVKAVARGRSASVEDVRKNMGGGRVLGADDAHAVNMTCGTYTFDETIRKARDAAKTGNKASIVVPQIAAVEEQSHVAEAEAHQAAEPNPAKPEGGSVAKARNRIALLG
jgi:signal peptide peptidase SppA